MGFLSPNMEDYLKTIYRLCRLSVGGMVHSSDVAKEMGLRKASVSKATDVLVSKGVVQKDKGKGLYLTGKGLEYARHIEQRYDVITKFLHEVLGVEIETARRDACGVEHVISGECYHSICAYIKKKTVG